jgi:hypothetical protein
MNSHMFSQITLQSAPVCTPGPHTGVRFDLHMHIHVILEFIIIYEPFVTLWPLAHKGPVVYMTPPHVHRYLIRIPRLKRTARPTARLLRTFNAMGRHLMPLDLGPVLEQLVAPVDRAPERGLRAVLRALVIC